MENTVRVVLGVLSLAVGMAYVVRLLADWPRRPDQRHFKYGTLKGPTMIAGLLLLLGVWWLVGPSFPD